MPFSGPELCAKSACQTVELLARREIEPVDLLEAARRRIDQVEPVINALPTRCLDRAKQAISALPAQSLLKGLPVAIKDLSQVAGVRTTFGTRGYADFIPNVSDPLIELMEDRGAVVIGKSNTPEMGAGGNTFNAVFGATCNPWNISRNAGGSSGGSAAALAAGEVWLGHGSDLGGSLRTPAAYCGVVGLRPTPGRAGGGSVDNAFGIESVQGPMARDVADCALMLDSMTGFDPRLPISLAAPDQPFLQAARSEIGSARIAYAPTHDGLGEVEGEIDTILRAVLAKLEPALSIDEYCPRLPDLERIYRILRAVTWAAGPGRQPDHIRAHYKDTLKDNIAFAGSFTSDDLVDAIRGRSLIYHNMRQFFDRFDVMACPVVGVEPGPIEQEYPTMVNGKPMTNYMDWLRYSFLATTAALPALSMPVGFTASGMPVGLQLIGPTKGEAKLLQIASRIERELNVGITTPIDPRGPDGGSLIPPG